MNCQALIEFALNVDQPSAHWSHFFFKDKYIAGLGASTAGSIFIGNHIILAVQFPNNQNEPWGT